MAIVGLLHRGIVYGAPSSYQIVDGNDVLIIEGDPEEIRAFMDATGFELEGSGDVASDISQTLGSADVTVVEAIVTPGSQGPGRTARGNCGCIRSSG